jgi:hypothetical protein
VPIQPRNVWDFWNKIKDTARYLNAQSTHFPALNATGIPTWQLNHTAQTWFQGYELDRVESERKADALA